MLTLKHAMSLKKEEIQDIKKDLIKNITKNAELNAYIDSAKYLQDCLEESPGMIPILIKDNICVKNKEITCSSKILKNFISPYNATVIEKLNANNMCAFGRSNMDEFGMGSTTENSCYGRTKNPLDTSRVPGGSSGGAAAAVSAGIAIAALGSDTGGSIRQPASYCGIVGLKPSYGRVSRYGLIAYSSSLDQIGPLTKNVEDASLLLDIISGKCNKDSTSLQLAPTSTFNNLNDAKTFKIAALSNFIDHTDHATQKAYHATIKTLEKMGHKVVKKEILDLNYHISTYYILATAEASSNLARYDGVRYGARIEAHDKSSDIYFSTRNLFGNEVKKRIMLGSFVLSSGYYEAYYLKAQKVREIIKAQYNEIFNDCDLILSPVSPTIAPHFGDLKESLDMYLSDIYTIGINLAGLPAISLPVMIDKDSNMPVGMQFIGRFLDEQSVLDVAYALEKELGLLNNK